MIVRFLTAALCAGLVVGAVMTPVQYARVIPLIVHAETYESGDGGHGHASGGSFAGAAYAAASSRAAVDNEAFLLAHGPAGGHAGDHHGDDGSASPVESRLFGTLLANLVTGAGFALLLAAASLMLNVPVTAANGAIWGLAGFAAVSLAPAMGLPPELPAMPAGDLGARQLWWAMTAGLSALALYLLALRPQTWAKVLGIALLFAPHLIGAPRPDDLTSPVPPTLAAEFAVAALVTAAFFWTILGIGVGHAIDRSGVREA